MKRNGKKLLGMFLALGMLASIAACGQPNAAQPSTTAPSPTASAATALYTAGTYEAEAKGNNGPVKVSVTVTGDAITEVKVLEHAETAGIADAPIERIPAAIVDGQTLAVDTVSGATNTSKAILDAAEECLTKAGADIAALKVKAGGTQTGEQIEKTADVVVIGGGGAGLVAAITATENNASVIVLEKTAVLGGNTLVCGGIYNCPDPELQEPEGIEDSPEFFAQQTWESGDKVANKELVDLMCFNAYDGYQWLKGIGVEFEDHVTQGAGSLYRRTHGSTQPQGTGFITAYEKTLAKTDLCEILMETPATEIIMENGKAVGVLASDSKGNQFTIHANKAVILATGGFAGNVELRQKYCQGDKWPDLGPSVKTTYMAGVTGDGIIMAEKIGAGFVDMDQIQLLHLGNPKTGATKGVMPVKGRNADEVIFVNQEGNRFVREDGRRDVMCQAIIAQTDGLMYIIHDSTKIDLNDPVLAGYLESGDTIMGETLEELAEKIGVPAENLIASVEGYNACVDAGKDEETGRELLVAKIGQGPFFACPRVPSAHHTMGGVRIDTECHVLDADGKIIEGLLAAGEVTGGIHGGNRVGGNAVVDTVVFGRIAGETASK